MYNSGLKNSSNNNNTKGKKKCTPALLKELSKKDIITTEVVSHTIYTGRGN